MHTFAHITLVLSLSSTALASPVVRHDAKVRIDVESGSLQVEDTLTVPAELIDDKGIVRLQLHEALAVEVKRGELVSVERPQGLFRLTRVRPDDGKISLVYKGRIVHAPMPMEEEHARSFSETRGIISTDGVYLSPASGWLPRIGNELVEANLEVSGLPPGWSVVSESAPTDPSRERSGSAPLTFRAEKPSDGVHLVAGRWTRESTVGDRRKQAGEEHSGALTRNAEGVVTPSKTQLDDVVIDVLLRAEDPALSQRYLDVARQYLRMYEELLGPYPWSRFSVVENFWETGYGMPSFTLLGPKVIRFPFLLHSSFPHELLHNWWGNGVYVEPGGGNWSEGLTAYLADHLVQEQRGKGEQYRHDALVRYADYVDGDADFPLRTFSERRSRASEAVGYGKWMMVTHMLRRELGDEVFTAGLRRLYEEHKHQRASFDDVRASFEQASGRSLESFFSSWVDGVGAPRLRWTEVRSARAGASGPWKVEVTLEQTQDGESFPMTVPVAIALANGDTVYASARFEGGREQERALAAIEASAEPLRVKIDPHYDVFRALHDDEVAPTLSRTLGGERMLFVLPTLASNEEVTEWRGFAEKICGPASPRCRVVSDAEVGTLPDDAAVWVLGYGNNLRGSAVIGALRAGASFDDGRFRVGEQTQENSDHSLALTFEHPRAAGLGLTFVATDRAAAIPGLARKLPHYGKYGFLGFEGTEPTNVLKGAWEPTKSPLVADVKPGARATFALEKRAPLASLPPPFDAEDLTSWVRELSKPEYEGRGYGSEGLARATAAVVAELTRAGFETAKASRCFDDDKGPGGKRVRACNVVVTLPGRDPSLPAVVLGAHLDHLGRGWPEARTGYAGKVHPGANDNASGVSVLLAVARKMKADGPRARTLHFVIFTGEEAGLRGSRQLVRELGLSGEGKAPSSSKIAAMVNLDTVGRRVGGPFLVAGHESASEWVHAFMGVGFVTGIESRMAAQGLSASDHQAFLEVGVPAVHVFAGPAPGWHTPDDVAADVEPDTLVDAAVLTHELLGWLGDRETPLTSSSATSSATRSSQAPAAGARKVALGTIPDMTFAGTGVRLKGTMPGSPAEAAGLREGDVLVGFGDWEVKDLRALAVALREAEAGAKVKLKVRRGQEDLVVEVELVAR